MQQNRILPIIIVTERVTTKLIVKDLEEKKRVRDYAQERKEEISRMNLLVQP